METETRKDVEQMQKKVKERYLELKRTHFSYFSPMVVGKFLMCLKDTRDSLMVLQALPMKQQEELAWLTLNGCKLIYDIAHPLIYYSCGKYVYESLAFAALSMENVINLCTVRHVVFRMKIYASVFYGALSQGFTEESTGILEHALKEIANLREREELDPPVPEITLTTLQQCDEDLAIMKFVLDCWKDSDNLNFGNAVIDKYTKSLKKPPAVNFQARCIEELIKVHLLSGGNVNENFIKRSGSLCKAALNVISETSSNNEDLLLKFSPDALYEFAYLLLLEGDDEDLTEKAKERFKALLTSFTAEEDADPGYSKSKSNIEMFCSILDLMNHSTKGELLQTEPFQRLLELLEEVNYALFDETAYRSKAFFGKVAYKIFNKILYQPIQKLLSSKNAQDLEELSKFADPLLIIVKMFDLTNHPDAIFSHSVALLAGNVLYEIKEYRPAISLLKECISTIENERAARVDYYMNLPEDVRDVFALQRQSFTTKSEMFDWFHSEKRLGAHAFAGFGIFGLSSSADRGDQALAEIHSDLLSLYFRAEISYAVKHYKERALHKAIADDIAAKKAAETPAMKAAKDKKTKLAKEKKARLAATLKSSSETRQEETKSLTMTKRVKPVAISIPDEVSLEKLQVIPYLKVYCAKNSYALALLYMEMAKFETASSQQQEKYLQQAVQCLEEVEQQEQQLIHSFADFTILTDNTKKYPIVLSRSHRYIYVIPVATRKLCQKVSYFRILAKERGSGTDVSVYNDSMPGSEQKIPVAHYLNNTSLQQVVVRIGPLRSGEMYMFGSAGYLIDDPSKHVNQISQTDMGDQVVGGVSPTSPVVEAVNPLPTILLWSSLGETALQLGYYSISSKASFYVCQRFFLTFPEQKLVTLSSGETLFLYDEPAFCALAIQQSTTHLLHAFVSSFLRYEKLTFHPELFGDQMNWSTDRKPIQLKYLQSLSKATAMMTLTTSMGNQELTIKLLTFIEQVIMELMKYDEVAVSKYLEKYLLCCLISVQRISKRHWHVLEHTLYQVLLFQYLKLALRNANLKPAMKLLADYYPEIREKEIDKLVKPTEKEVLESILACQCFVDQSLPAPVKEIVLGDMRKLLQEGIKSTQTASPTSPRAAVSASPRAEGDEIGSFWRLDSSERLLKLQNQAIELSAPPAAGASVDRVQLEKYLLQDQSQSYSDYLEVIAQMCQELVIKRRFDLVMKLLQRYPICAEYLSASVQEYLHRWRNHLLLLPLPIFAQYKSLLVAGIGAAPAAGSAGKDAGKKPAAKGKATEAVDPAAASTVEPPKVPDRYLTCTEEEIQRQMMFLGDLFVVMVNSSIAMTSLSKKNDFNMNYFTKSIDSPNQLILPENKERYQRALQESPDTVEEKKGSSSPEKPLSPRAEPNALVIPYLPEQSLTFEQQLQLLGMSIECFNRSRKLQTATNSCVRLWNLIMKEYHSPLTFMQQLHSWQRMSAVDQMEIIGKDVIHQTFLSIAELLNLIYPPENNQQFMLSATSGDFSPMVPAPSSFYEDRDKKMKVALLTQVFLFYIKVEWLQKDFLLDLVNRALPTFKIFCEVPLLHEFCDLIEKEVLGLLIQAQEQLIEDAKLAVQHAEETVQNFVTAYEENERKKRKKKLRIERTEKTEEELLFEKEKNYLESIIQEKQMILQTREEEMSQMQSFQEVLASVISKERRQLLGLQKEVFLFFQEIEDRFGKNCDYSVVLPSMDATTISSPQASPNRRSSMEAKQLRQMGMQHFVERFHAIRGKYNRLAKTLRNQKEKVLLTKCLHDFSNFYIKTQQFSYLKQTLYDAIDGLFNTMDTCVNWSKVSESLLNQFDHQELIRGVPYVLIALGKLSKYCGYSMVEATVGNAVGKRLIPQQIQIDEKLNYSTMGSEIASLLFKTSIGHPEHLLGFTAYECYELQGFQSFSSDIIFPLFAMNQELITNYLLYYVDTSLLHNYFETNYTSKMMKLLPLLCLQEYLAMVCCHNPQLWLTSRLQRIRVLIQCHAFAEAVAMFASIPYHLQMIQQHKVNQEYALQYVSPFHSTATTEKEILQYLELSSNGLRYYGNPPFLNSVTPFEESSNLKALQWLQEFPTVMEKYLSQYQMKVPEAFWTAEQKAKIEHQRQLIKEIEEKAATADPKDKKKGGGAAGGDATAELLKEMEKLIPQITLFTPHQFMEIHLLVANFFVEIVHMSESNYSIQFQGMPATASKDLPTNHLLHFAAESKKSLNQAKALLYKQFSSAGSSGFTSHQIKNIHDYYKMHFEKEITKGSLVMDVTLQPPPHVDESSPESKEDKETAPSLNPVHELFHHLTVEEKQSVSMVLSDSEWLLTYSRIAMLENVLLQYHHNYREVYGNCFQLMKLLKNPLFFQPSLQQAAATTSPDLGSDTSSILASYWNQHHHYSMILSNFWFQVREFQVITNYYQGRYRDLMKLIHHILQEAEMVAHPYFQMKCTYFFGKAAYKLGHWEEGLESCRKIFTFCVSKRHFDILYQKAIILKAMILKEKIRNLIPCGIIPTREFYNQQNKHQNIYYYWIEMVELLRHGKKILEKIMYEEIGIYYYDMNLTYHNLLTPNTGNLTQKHDLFPPKLYHFSRIHNNNPPLTVLPSHLSHPEPNSQLSANIQMSYFTQSLGLYHPQRNYLLRLGPVDEKETFGKSPFLNIYFVENRVLLELQSLLLQTIEEIRSFKVEDIIQKEYQLFKEENNRNNLKSKPKEDYFFVLDESAMNSTSALGEEGAGTRNRSQEYDIVFKLPYQPNLLEFFEDKQLLFEQMTLGESCLKLLRHTLFILPIHRASIYYYTIKSRVDNLLQYQLYQNYQIFENNTIYNIGNQRKEYEITIERLVIQPLLVIIQYIVQSHCSYLWDIGKLAYQLLVEIYGNVQDIEIDELFLEDMGNSNAAVSSSSPLNLRLRSTIHFFQMAVQMNQQRMKLLSRTVELSTLDPSFQTPLPSMTSGFQVAELNKLLVNIFSSSLSPILPFLEEVPPKEGNEEDATGKGGKDAKAPAKGGKDAKGGGATGSSSVTPGHFSIDQNRNLTGRDGLLLLSLLLKEIFPTGEFESYENYVTYDLHLLLKKNFPVYEQHCSLTKYGSDFKTSILKEIGNVTVPVSSISTSWKVVATPKDWYVTNPPPAVVNPNQPKPLNRTQTVSSEQDKWSIDRLALEKSGLIQGSGNAHSKDLAKFSKPDWNDGAGNTSISGLYSHVAWFVLLGDVQKAVVANIGAADGKGKGKTESKVNPKDAAAAANAANGSESQKPILTKIIFSRNEIVHLEKRLRRLFYVIATEKREVVLQFDHENVDLLAEYAQLMITFYCMLRFGYCSTRLMQDLFPKDQSMKEILPTIIELQDSGVLKFSIENLSSYYPLTEEQTQQQNQNKIQFSLPMNTKIIQNAYQLLTVHQDQLNIVDNDLCHLIRLAISNQQSR